MSSPRDLKPMPKFGSGEQAEDSILGGELDFVLGNHYSPLAAKAKGITLCWLAVPMWDHADRMHQRPIASPAALANTQAKATIDYPEAADVIPLQVLNLEYVCPRRRITSGAIIGPATPARSSMRSLTDS